MGDHDHTITFYGNLASMDYDHCGLALFSAGMGDVEREIQMLQSYSYEVLVKAQYEDDGETKKTDAVIIDSGTEKLVEPTREDLLLENAEKIKELGVAATEVVVNIRPFLG